MPNRRPRGIAISAESVQRVKCDRHPGYPRAGHHLSVHLLIDAYADPEDALHDIRILLTKVRDRARSLTEEFDEQLIRGTACGLRRPALERMAATLRRLKMGGERARKALEETPWPTANEIAKDLGAASWKLTDVRKVVRKLKKAHRRRPCIDCSSIPHDS